MGEQRLKLVKKDLSFRRISKAEVPRERKGKHHGIVSEIVHDLSRLRPGEALEIPRGALGASKLENVRAALNRAVKKLGLEIGTSSNDDNFYVWIENRRL
jgi:hypothetical protein